MITILHVMFCKYFYKIWKLSLAKSRTSNISTQNASSTKLIAIFLLTWHTWQNKNFMLCTQRPEYTTRNQILTKPFTDITFLLQISTQLWFKYDPSFVLRRYFFNIFSKRFLYQTKLDNPDNMAHGHAVNLYTKIGNERGFLSGVIFPRSTGEILCKYSIA
jgi:hypothetical protein